MATTFRFANPAFVIEGDGSIVINLADGSSFTAASIGELQAIMTDALPDSLTLAKWTIAHFLALDSQMNSPEVWNNKSVTLDFEQANAANIFRIV